MSSGSTPPHAPTRKVAGRPEPTAETRVDGGRHAPPVLTFQRGDQIGRYVVLDTIGRGGMGIVVSAYDPELDRNVALKLLGTDPGASGDDSRGARLQREAQAMAKLAHPNVITIHDVGQIQGQLFIAMELVHGQTLRAWQREEGRTWREIVGAYVAAGEGLAAAHEVGLVHRDFKPDNVLMGDDGRVRVLDFGLARPSEGAALDPDLFVQDTSRESTPSARPLLSAPLTEAGTIVGTPPYMSPEQHTGGSTDARSDQFSFCVALHEGLYGRRPFAGKTSRELVRAIREGEVRDPPSRSEVPSWLRQVVLRGLEFSPDARHPSMATLLSQLRRDPAAMWRRRLGVGALVVAIAGMAYGAFHLQQQRAELCSEGDARVADVWADGRKASIREQLLATGETHAGDTWNRTAAVIDTYMSDWAAMRREACEATRLRGEQSEQLLSLRRQCLDERLEQAQALIDLLGDADSTVARKATEAAHGLGSLDACARAERLVEIVAPPGDPPSLAAIAEAHRDLARARALLSTGKWQEARPHVDRAATTASQVAHEPLQAEVALVLGRLHTGTGDLELAASHLGDAVLYAEAGRDDLVRLDALTRRASVLGHRPEQLAEAEATASRAEAILERVNGGPLRRADLLEARATTYLAAGRFADAEPLFRKVLDLRRDHLAPTHPEIAEALGGLAIVLAKLGRADEARSVAEEAISSWERALGPGHPDLAEHRATLAGARL